MERYYPPGVTKEARLRTAIGLFSIRAASERSSSNGRKEKARKPRSGFELYARVNRPLPRIMK